MRGFERAAGPGNGLHRRLVHCHGLAGGRGIVVAEDRDGATRHVFHRAVGDPAGIGAIADQIAEKDIALGTLAFGVGEARRHRFAVAVDVCQQGDHDGPILLPCFKRLLRQSP